MATQFTVQHGDVLEVPSDLLLLKYAGSFCGAGEQVATVLLERKLCSHMDIRPGPDDFAIVETAGAIAPVRVLFLGTKAPDVFDYEHMRHFGRRAVQVLARQRLGVETLTTTVHGVRYGLDAGESLRNLMDGLQAGLAAEENLALSRIVFVERDPRRARVLSGLLPGVREELKESAGAPQAASSMRAKAPDPDLTRSAAAPVAEAPARPVRVPDRAAPPKRHVFVAMPYSEEFLDVYEFGIYAPVRKCGFICEKVDETSFTGDILRRITERIETAEFVIADLTEGRPNVYLEVGYAWGKAVPVIFLAREGQSLHFDVSTHRCIFYRSIRQLAEGLERLIRGLSGGRNDAV